jgi:methionine aminopeptidase
MSFNLTTQFDDPDTQNKYIQAGKLISKCLDKLLKNIKIGDKLSDLSKKGDDFILNSFSGANLNKKINVIAFPTCVCKNEYAGYLNHSDDIVNEFDLLKIEMGGSVDGFPALICYTYYVNNSDSLNIDVDYDKKKNLIECLSKMSKKSIEILKHDEKNTKFVDEMNKLAHEHSCNLLDANLDKTEHHIPGQVIYQISKNVVFGRTDNVMDEDELHNLIIMRQSDNYDFKLASQEFFKNEVYFIDLAISTGTGKINECMIYKPSIYLRNIDTNHGLKLKTSRETLNSFNNNIAIPVDISKLNNVSSFGLNDCIKNMLLEPFLITKENKNEFIARIGFTVIIKESPKNNIVISARSLDNELSKFS